VHVSKRLLRTGKGENAVSQIRLPPWLVEGIKELTYTTEEAADMREYFERFLAKNLSPEIKGFWDEMARVMIAEGESSERAAFAFMGIELTR